MVLQYKGFKNNWCYEEGERIVWANVYVGGVLEGYTHPQTLEEAQTMHKRVDDVIREETATENDIVYLIGEMEFDKMRNVSVVTLERRNSQHTTYVFVDAAYILNEHGGTVQRIS